MDYIVSVTNKCNLNCSYCYEKHLLTEIGQIDDITDDITNFINCRNDVESISFFGGEPLLFKKSIKRIVSSVKANYTITTNGVLLDDEFLNWAEINNVHINMSHDGKYCSERNADPALLDEKLKLLLKYQPYSVVQMVYTEKSLDYLFENIRFLKKLGVKVISAALDVSTVSEDIKKFSERLACQWKKVSELKDIKILELHDYIVSINRKEKSRCEICKSKMFINWDGKIYPCMQFQNISDFQCGDIFSGLDVEKTVKKHQDYSAVPDRCSGCDISGYCRNSCACKKMGTTGNLRCISDAYCALERILLKNAMEKNAKIVY